jgi:hypothetical protein
MWHAEVKRITKEQQNSLPVNELQCHGMPKT